MGDYRLASHSPMWRQPMPVTHEPVETTDEEIEAMLPKEILKYAEKVENIEEAVLQEINNHEKHQELPRFSPLTGEEMRQLAFAQASRGFLQQHQQFPPIQPGQVLR